VILQVKKGKFKAFSKNKMVFAHGPPRKPQWLGATNEQRGEREDQKQGEAVCY